ncbi:membrane protein FxsA [Bacillus sp. 7586-K]|nr:membrane protein FxsA [Bacillus sp. 7586-K]
MRFLTIIFILIPILEISVLLISGKTIGVLPTLLLLFLTGIIGAWLAKRQGLETMRKMQEQLRYGQIPGDAIVDSICIFFGGLLLLTPGYITDICGFLLLLPFTRNKLKPVLFLLMRRWIEKNNVTIIR